jgi:hypothetical protein
MQQFSNVRATTSHPKEPLSRNCTQLRTPTVKPRINGGISRDGARKSQQLVHNGSSQGRSEASKHEAPAIGGLTVKLRGRTTTAESAEGAQFLSARGAKRKRITAPSNDC